MSIDVEAFLSHVPVTPVNSGLLERTVVIPTESRHDAVFSFSLDDRVEITRITDEPGYITIESLLEKIREEDQKYLVAVRSLEGSEGMSDAELKQGSLPENPVEAARLIIDFSDDELRRASKNPNFKKIAELIAIAKRFFERARLDEQVL